MHQARRRGNQRRHVAGRDENPGAAVLDDLRRSADRGRDHRQPRGHRFEHHVRRPFPIRRQPELIEAGQERRHVGDSPDEAHAIGEPELARAARDRIEETAGAGDLEDRVGVCRRDPAGGAEKHAEILLRLDAPDRSDLEALVRAARPGETPGLDTVVHDANAVAGRTVVSLGEVRHLARIADHGVRGAKRASHHRAAHAARLELAVARGRDEPRAPRETSRKIGVRARDEQKRVGDLDAVAPQAGGQPGRARRWLRRT